MKKIKLSKGKYAIVDDEDYRHINKYKWSYHNAGYACRVIWKNNKQIMILMHRYIMKTPKNKDTDHKNRNKLDNRKKNLRICSRSNNMKNMLKWRIKTASSKYKGVTWFKAANKWMAQIKVNKKKLHLGLFVNEIDAAKAYNKAAKKYFTIFVKTSRIKA